MNTAVTRAISWTEQGLVPDSVIRAGIRRLLKQRLEEIDAANIGAAAERLEHFVETMNRSAVALLPEKANEQHYEVPAVFFEHALGAHRKYSSCFWPEGCESLSLAEEAALRITCERAGLQDGQEILELGCGWGSLTLWMAAHYPASHITAVSNSTSQREFILADAEKRGLRNLTVLTADMNVFDIDAEFDRVVSVEMIEHMRNWEELFRRISQWLKPGGRFFMHVFCHRLVPYAFEARDASDWMSTHFFSGGMMPSDDLPLRFQKHLAFLRRWRWDGTHYEKTANAWLANVDREREAVMPVLAATYGEDAAGQWFHRWRIFFMACAELFGFNDGQEWLVSHYLFERPAA